MSLSVKFNYLMLIYTRRCSTRWIGKSKISNFNSYFDIVLKVNYANASVCLLCLLTIEFSILLPREILVLISTIK